jgi:hypothetical protein
MTPSPWKPPPTAGPLDAQLECRRRGFTLRRIGREAASANGRDRAYTHAHVRNALGLTPHTVRDDHPLRRYIAANVLGIPVDRLPRPRRRRRSPILCMRCGSSLMM